MEEEQQHDYGGVNNNNMGDLRRFFSPIPMTPVQYHPPPPPPQQSLFSTGAGGAFTPLHYPHQQYEMMLVMGGGRSHVPDNVLQVDFHSDSTTTTSTTAGTAPTATITVPAGVGYDGGIALGDGGGSTVRWPRQETLTLLEVRSVLDHKFKEANHKGPLWDEVSRIMSEEHGYQRSGKKCREKFENLYKYYKKTKGGKAGRQDGKHYRFFRQLEALYGEPAQNHTSIPHQFHSGMNAATTNISHYDQEDCFHSISLSNSSSSDLNTSSSEDVNNLNRAKRREKRSWKSKIKGFIDLQMRKIMEKQEAWLEKMMRTLEHKEKERMMREEEWRSRESERIEREHKLWAEGRSWIEARDRSLMDNLAKLTGKELAVEEKDLSSSNHSDELLALHQRQLHQSKVIEDRDDQRVSNSKKRKENWRIESGDGSNSSHHLCSYGEIDLGGSGGQNPMNDSFKFLLGNEGDSHMLGSYGVKLNKAKLNEELSLR